MSSHAPSRSFGCLKSMGALALAVMSLPFTSVLAQDAPAGEFRNPLNAGADPSLVHYDGNYYLSTTQQNHLAIWKSDSLATLATVEPIFVWRERDLTRSVEMWAPALHQFESEDGLRWYIYYTAADSTIADPVARDSSHRLYVLESDGDDPTGPYEFKAQIADTNSYVIDGEPFLHDEEPYFAWTGPGRGFDGGPQQLFIAHMKNPWTIEGDIVELPADGGCEEVREGPTPLYGDGKTFLTYSTCDTGKPDYQLWSIAIPTGADPLNSDLWQQVPGPLFSRNDAAGVWGPGHHFFFKSPDGTEDWIAYHAKNTPEFTYDFRSTRAQRIGWHEDGTPDLGEPIPAGGTITLPSGDLGQGAIAINDFDTDGETMWVTYGGRWEEGRDCGNTCFYGDDHFSGEAGATATYHFSGGQIAIYASLGPDHGYATFSVDGGEPSERVSYYNGLRVGEQLMYTSPVLEPGEHTLTVIVTGEKPDEATDPIITVDRAEVYPGPFRDQR